MNDRGYDYIVRQVGAVGPHEKNPNLDHIWHLKADMESLCGLRGCPDGLDPAGRLCMRCRQSVDKMLPHFEAAAAVGPAVNVHRPALVRGAPSWAELWYKDYRKLGEATPATGDQVFELVRSLQPVALAYRMMQMHEWSEIDFLRTALWFLAEERNTYYSALLKHVQYAPIRIPVLNELSERRKGEHDEQGD